MPPSPGRRTTPTKPGAAGYSATPLAGKLGIKDGCRLLVLDAPTDYAALLAPLPAGVRFVSRAGATVDLVHVFAVRKAGLARRLARLRPDAAVWVSWPKKSARVPTDITEDVIRAVALPLGYVDAKVCAVTEVWSGLKLVVRREHR